MVFCDVPSIDSFACLSDEHTDAFREVSFEGVSEFSSDVGPGMELN